LSNTQTYIEPFPDEIVLVSCPLGCLLLLVVNRSFRDNWCMFLWAKCETDVYCICMLSNCYCFDITACANISRWIIRDAAVW